MPGKISGAGEEEQPQPLLRSPHVQVPWSFSPDGTRLAYHEMNAATGFDLWTVPVHTGAGRRTAGTPELSPNGVLRGLSIVLARREVAGIWIE